MAAEWFSLKHKSLIFYWKTQKCCRCVDDVWKIWFQFMVPSSVFLRSYKSSKMSRRLCRNYIFVSIILFFLWTTTRRIRRIKNNKIVHNTASGERATNTHTHTRATLYNRIEHSNEKNFRFFSTVFMSTKVSFDFFLMCFVLLRAAIAAAAASAIATVVLK